MTLLHPIWLVLVVPAAFFLYGYAVQSKLVLGLRLGVLALLFLALAGPALRVTNKLGTVVVVIDQSLSMPEGSGERAEEMVSLIEEAMPAGAAMGVVAFGHKTAVAKFPNQAFRDTGLDVDGQGSDLSAGIGLALDLVPPGGSGRLLVISDGRWTGRDPLQMAARAATRSIAIDYRSLDRDLSGDMGISRMDVPQQVSPFEGFTITAWIDTPFAQEVDYELRRGGVRIASGSKALGEGANRLVFRDVPREPGTRAYRLTVQGATEDPFPQNNRAEFLVGVRGPKPLLVVSSRAGSTLAALLRAGGLQVTNLVPKQVDWSLASLPNYSAVVLENVPAGEIGKPGLANLAEWVKETGAGLFVTGGGQSYAPGGYFKSPLDPVLPVSMELRQEHRKLALAMVIAVDRSGSMGAVVGSGQTKMDLANLASAQVLDLLSASDEFGLLAVDSSAHEIVTMDRIGTRKEEIRSRILSIGAGGGGIFVFEAMSNAARMLEPSIAGARHMLLFADAADAEQPGDYKNLLEECRAAGMTVSVVGLGSDLDTDAGLLIDIAERGGGRVYFTEFPEELPRIFAQDTFVVARSTFIKEPTQARFTAALQSMTSQSFPDPPLLDGYNLCYLREGADISMISNDEYEAPILASWFAGSGRVACYTGEASGAYSGAMAGWAHIGDFYTGIARWVAGYDANLPGNNLLTQALKDGNLTVTLHLDPERIGDPFTATPQVALLRGRSGEKPHASRHPMTWTTPHRLELVLPLVGEETAIASLAFDDEDNPSAPREALSPVRLPYSPEYEPAGPEKGPRVLTELARMSDGIERTQLDRIWKDLPVGLALLDLTPYALALMMLLFLAEILERRTGYLSAIGTRHWRLPEWSRAKQDKAAPSPKSAAPKKPRRTPAPEPRQAAPEPTEPPPPAPKSSLDDALARAADRAKKRTGK